MGLPLETPDLMGEPSPTFRGLPFDGEDTVSAQQETWSDGGDVSLSLEGSPLRWRGPPGLYWEVSPLL